MAWFVPIGGTDSPKEDSADKGRYARTPDACAVLTDTDVAKVLTNAGKEPAGGSEDYSICRWEAPALTGQLASTLEVDLVRYEGKSGTTADQAAHQRFALAARPAPPFQGFTGKQEAVPGLGDEATLAGSVDKIIDGKAAV